MRDLLKSPDDEILRDSARLHAAERLLQLVVDTMLDINQHFIRELKLTVSEDYQGTFHTLGENAVLPTAFAKRIAPVVGLRNRILHRYETPGKKLFVRTFKKNFPDFQKYVRLISTHLEKMQ
ncbi:MAG: DUF86 domain-containing protein [Chloroflexi bacterium]|nr:DUF86 domain-containing protein [Chloroflexota bacterium]